jgi:hypothetical protein
MSAPSTGSTTDPASVPATVQAGPPTAAAPQTDPVRNTAYNPPAPKQKNFAPRQFVATTSGRTNPGLSMLLSGASDQVFSGIKRNDSTYIVPCLIQLYYVISLMDTQMVHTKRFTDANMDWHPFVSQLYFAILVFYQVLKNQSIGSTITHGQRLFLDYLDDQFKAEHLKIPGPLVIFFQALAANAGPNENYGNVVFGIPNNPGVTQANEFRFANQLNMLLPNVIFILDQFMRVLNDIAPAGAAPGAIGQASTDRVYMSIFGTAAANAAVNRFCMLTPSARHEVQVTTSLLSGLASSSNIWRSTLPFDPANNLSTYTAGNNEALLELDQILGFRGFGNTEALSFAWFGQVCRIMQPYGDFFKDTTSLGAITTTGIGISYIRTVYHTAHDTPTTLLHEVITRDVRYQQAGTLRYEIPNYYNVSTRHHHSEEYLDEVVEQAGMMTQLNTDWTLVNASPLAVARGPLRGNVITGPLEQRLDARISGWVMIGNTIPPIISGYYHTPSALKFS